LMLGLKFNLSGTLIICSLNISLELAIRTFLQTFSHRLLIPGVNKFKNL
jgi:hypothetical protein